MKRGVFRLVGLACAALAACASPAPAAPVAERIIAVGDLHGDYAAWREIAAAARLTDAKGHWAGGETVLVQAGDIVDREPDSLRIIHHLIRLQREAEHVGGRVIMLVGNHEAMNATGDLRYVTPGEFAAFADRDSARRRDSAYDDNRLRIEAAYRAQNPALTAEAIRQAWMDATPLGKLEHQQAWAPDGELGRWVRANPAVVKIGESLFVHGGLSIRYVALSLDEINRRVAAALGARETAETSIINDPYGPLWYRGLITRDPEPAAPRLALPTNPAKPFTPSIDEEISQVLSAYGAKRIIVAHTPNLAGIALSNGGRLVRIDTGISRFYGGALSFLEIQGEQVIPHLLPRVPQAKGSK